MKKPLTLLTSAVLLALPAAASHPQLKSGLDLPGFDRSVRAQDDLYGFANGRWQSSTEIPADLSNYGTFTQLDEAARAQLHDLLEATLRNLPAPGTEERKAADFYASFMDNARVDSLGLAPLADELSRIDAIQSVADLVRYFGYDQTIGVGAPIEWSSPQDPGDAKVYISEISQSGLTMPDRDYYLNDEPKYREYRAKLTTYVGALLELAGTGAAQAPADAQHIVELETRLAQAQWTKVDNRDAVKTYNKVTLAEAAHLAPQIDWTQFFGALAASPERFVVSQPSFVSAVGEMVQSVPLDVWRAYLRYQLLDTYAPYLPTAFEDLHFDFHQRALSGVQEQRPRWKRAVTLLDGSVGEIIGRMYVERHFPPKAKQRAHVLVENLMKAYRSSIDQIGWMGPQTRLQAQQKLARIGIKIGYPDKWRDYSALAIDAGDLLGNVRRSALFEQRRHALRLTGPVDRGEWHMTPQTVNAYYQPTMNEIVFPAAILQPPFFDADADDAVNYGGIGAVIGHEISHAFDDQGRKHDADGNLRDWWTPEDAARFRARAAQLAAQYSAYTVLDGMHVNGELTLGENIADLSGLAIAYKAYLIQLGGRKPPVIDGFTCAQRFFLGWAQVWRRKYRDDNLRMRILVDPHSPNQFRADGPPSNIDVFYDAFGLTPADHMFRPPGERVKIW